MHTTKITSRISKAAFKKLIQRNIQFGRHSFFHLDLHQRNLYKEEEMTEMLRKEQPRGVGRQKNGNIAVFYRRKNGYQKIILAEKHRKLEVVTFIDNARMPDWRAIKYE